MTYQQLGSSSLRVSRIAFGSMSFGPDEAENISLVHQAMELGINFFDTADIYQRGISETILGKALKPHRKDIILASKVGNQYRADGDGFDWNPSKKHILASIDGTLSRLQTDYLDLYQLHGGTIDDNIDETIEAFEQLQQQGKIRYYGISSIRPNVIREYVSRSAIVSVMMQYSLLDRRPEEACLDLLAAHNIGVLARGALAQGLLVDKPPRPYLDHSAAEVAAAAEAVGSLAKPRQDKAGTNKEQLNDGRSNSQRPTQNSADTQQQADRPNSRQPTHSKAATAIAYTLSHPAVTAAVVGIRTPAQLKEAAAAGAASGLSSNEIRLLQEKTRVICYTHHRDKT